MRSISFDAFKKRIRGNARKGMYKKYSPTTPVRKVKPDTIKVTPDTVIARNEHLLRIEPAGPVSPILKKDSLITLSDFLFETDSYKLKNEHYAVLDSLGKFLKKYPILEVSISGHTDNTGSERHNVDLSTRRADVVADYLENFGISFERITFQGFGSSKPISENSSESGRSKNRRVEILLRNKEKK